MTDNASNRRGRIILLVVGGACVIAVVMLVLPFVFGGRSAHHHPPGKEPTMNVRKLFDSSVAYFEAEHPSAEGELLPRQFPASVSLTPDIPLCKAGASRFESTPATWLHPSWQALNFEILEPHRYRYEFISGGTGAQSWFTARAIGDLDCDGIFSTFERAGTIDRHGAVKGERGLYKVNEAE